MNIKIYTKRGKKSYKESRLLNELQPIIEEKLAANPELIQDFAPANTFEELKLMHQRYAVNDIKFEEINEKDDNMAKRVNQEEIEEVDFNDDISLDDDNSNFIDPFNREQPTTYDYTLDGGFSKDDNNVNQEIRSDFSEPLSFEDAFELPTENEEEEPVDNTSKTSQKSTRNERKKPERPEPVNPSFDEMSSSDQRKQTKKFTKYIVSAVCALAEKGFVWFTTKDINAQKLAELEDAGEIDLSILVTLDSGQEVTVKEFFRQQELASAELAKFEEEEKKDLAEALAAVFLEKGIAPTKMQELLIVGAGMLIKKGAMAFGLKQQNNSILNQLQAMRVNAAPSQPTYQEPTYQAPIADEPIDNYVAPDLTPDDEMLEIDQVIETKE
jgi:hypothetical protein